MAEVAVEGVEQLRILAAAMKSAPKQMRDGVLKNLRTSVKPVTKAVQDTVRSAPSRGYGSTSGRARRAAHALNRTKGLSDATAEKRAAKKGTTAEAEKAAHRVKQAAKAASGAGLRDSIARCVSAAVSASGPAGVNATWRTRADRMPNLQRKLPKDFNNPKGWRHPVFGNRDVWVKQTGTPYFDAVIQKHRDELADSVTAALQDLADRLARESH